MHSVRDSGIWSKNIPSRVLRCGIAEANMIGTAAAMSVMGLKPVIHSFASFVTRRGFDQIFLSGAYAKKTLNIIGSEPGYKQTYWGGTHMAFEDIAMMRTVPDCRIFDIADGVQFNKLLGRTIDMKGISYYRTPLADNIAVYDEDAEFEIGKGNVLREGKECFDYRLRTVSDDSTSGGAAVGRRRHRSYGCGYVYREAAR